MHDPLFCSSISRRDAARMIGVAAAAGVFGVAPTRGELPQPAAVPNWSQLRAKIVGELFAAEDAAFEGLRQSLVWNERKPERAPGAIVRVASVEDVQHAVRFAAANKLKVAIRGGGHSWCASSMRDGGLLLDLARLDSLRIDPGSATAFAQPAVRGGRLATAAATHGLAFPAGHCASVPLSGYLLNGGIGWNSGAWGPACMSVEAVDVVDANGDLRRADARQNTDYYWAARGSGPGFFGVAVGYHLKLHPLPGSIRSRFAFFPVAELGTVAPWLNEVAATLPPQVEMTCILGSAPPDVPQEIAPAGGRVFMILATAFAADGAQADEMLSFLDSAPASAKGLLPPAQDTPFESLYAIMAQAMPAGRRYAVDLVWCDAAPAELLGHTAEVALKAPSPESFAMYVFLPPPPPDAPAMPSMAFSMISRGLVGAYGIWREPAADQAHYEWVQQVVAASEPVRSGHYVGESELQAEPNRASRCYSPQAWAKLGQLRAKLDPNGLFQSYLSVG